MQTVHTASLADQALRSSAFLSGRNGRVFACLLGLLAVLCLAYGLASWWGQPASPAQGHGQAMALARPEVLPVSDPKALRPVSEEDARRINAAIPLSGEANPQAKPLTLTVGDGANWLRAVDCMTAAIYYEAANEPVDGQRAVAQVILNRVRDPAFPNTVCGVVFEGAQLPTGCQFSFTCDGSMARLPSKSGWEKARAVAFGALSGSVFAPVGLATHYHADYVVPYWASSLNKIAALGAHIFYRWKGDRGLPSAFVARYEAKEEEAMRNGVMIAGALSGTLPEGEDGAMASSAPANRTVLAINGLSMAAAGHLPPEPEPAVVAKSGVRSLMDIRAPAASDARPAGMASKTGRWAISAGGARISPQAAIAAAPNQPPVGGQATANRAGEQAGSRPAEPQSSQ